MEARCEHHGVPTLHVRNVPDDLYDALRRRAEARRTSIGAEAIALLERGLRTELAGMRELIDDYGRRRPRARAGAPSAARLIRDDRDRA
jgi:plasmid stability protein